MLCCTTRSPNECIEKPSGVGYLSWWLYDRLQSALVARLPVRERFLHEIYRTWSQMRWYKRIDDVNRAFVLIQRHDNHLLYNFQCDTILVRSIRRRKHLDSVCIFTKEHYRWSGYWLWHGYHRWLPWTSSQERFPRSIPVLRGLLSWNVMIVANGRAPTLTLILWQTCIRLLPFTCDVLSMASNTLDDYGSQEADTADMSASSYSVSETLSVGLDK